MEDIVMRLKLKRGVTLMEMTIVMALLSIVIIMVVSFSTLVRNNVQAISSENDVLSDFDKVQYVFDTWIATFDNDEYNFYTNDNKLYAVYKKNTGRRYVLFLTNDGILTGSVPIGTTGLTTVVYNGTGTLSELGFNLRLNNETNKLLIDCRVTYTKYNIAGTKTETHKAHFLKATRVAGIYMGL